MVESPSYYAQPAPITDVTTVDPALFAALPTDTAGLCQVSTGLIVHEFLAGAYGVNPTEDRSGELETRTAADLVAAITAINDQPLRVARPPEQRLFGNCRQFCVLTTALLRRAGVRGRCRVGFVDYFEPGMWTDHWIVEHWSDTGSRWIRTDPQLDDVQQGILGIDFDAKDLPTGRFLSGGQAWQACRTGTHNPALFGIQDMRGLWFIAGATLRDLAALNKVETHTWDTWGAMNQMHGTLNDAQVDLVGTVAETTCTDDLTQIRDLYQHDGLTMAGTVVSQRTQTPVSLPT